VQKETGLPFAEGLDTVVDLPHTLTYAILYQSRLNSFNELPKDKRPPRYMWDRPYELSQYLEHVWDNDNNGDSKFKKTNIYEYNLEDVE
jgi:hypothetical protein